MNCLFNPLNQFEIYPLYILSIKKNLYILNTFYFYAFFIVLIFIIFFLLSKKQKFLYYSNFFNIFFIKILFFIQSVLNQNIFTHPFFIQSFFPLSLSLFFMILFTNIFGLIPYSYTNTSYIIETFMLSCSFFIGLTLLFIFFQGFKNFVNSFIPSDIPNALKPLLIVIEVISYVSRAFSLAIRLFANMMAGHTLLHILSDFTLKLGKIKYFFLIFPLIIVFLISILEIGVSFLQAYVFTLLVALYYNDSLKITSDIFNHNKLFIYKFRFLKLNNKLYF